jgi:hypothetical protein
MKRRALFFVAAVIIAGVSLAISLEKDTEIRVTDDMISRLISLQSEKKFLDLPGANAAVERAKFETLLNQFLSQLIQGLPQHPRKSWVLQQMEPVVKSIYLEDTEVRERCIEYLDRTLKVLGSPGSGTSFAVFLIFI